MNSISTSQVDQGKDLLQYRIFVLIGAALITAFMFEDTRLLSAPLADMYVDNRLYLQLPILGFLFIASFLPCFKTERHFFSVLGLTGVVFANYHLIITCWQVAQFPFPYEGTLLYVFFGIFILRLPFRFALVFVSIVSLSFIAMLTLYPIYAERSLITIGFVVAAQVIALVGAYSIQSAFQHVLDANDKLAQLNQVDGLTGIYNRPAFMEHARQMLEWSKRNNAPLAMFMVDIDHFKEYNDHYGHLAGDAVIQRQATMLKTIFKRDSDLIGRFGGEEFTCLSSPSSLKKAEHLAISINKAWRKQRHAHSPSIESETVNCSIGVYWCKPASDTTLEQLLELADQAMYESKARGRGCYTVKSTTQSPKAPRVA